MRQRESVSNSCFLRVLGLPLFLCTFGASEVRVFAQMNSDHFVHFHFQELQGVRPGPGKKLGWSLLCNMRSFTHRNGYDSGSQGSDGTDHEPRTTCTLYEQEGLSSRLQCAQEVQEIGHTGSSGVRLECEQEVLNLGHTGIIGL